MINHLSSSACCCLYDAFSPWILKYFTRRCWALLFPLEWRIKGGSHPRSSLHGRAGERTHDCPAEGRLVHLCRKWLVKKNQGNRAKDLVFVLQFALTKNRFSPFLVYPMASIVCHCPIFLSLWLCCLEVFHLLRSPQHWPCWSQGGHSLQSNCEIHQWIILSTFSPMNSWEKSKIFNREIPTFCL